MSDRTQDPFGWFDEIFLVDEFQISWSDSCEIRVQNLASRLPLLIRQIPSRCLWSLAATLAQIYLYLFAFHHFWMTSRPSWLEQNFQGRRTTTAVECFLPSLKILNEVSGPCHGKGGANAVICILAWCCWKIVPLASCPHSQSRPSWLVYKGRRISFWPMRLVIVEFWFRDLILRKTYSSGCFDFVPTKLWGSFHAFQYIEFVCDFYKSYKSTTFLGVKTARLSKVCFCCYQGTLTWKIFTKRCLSFKKRIASQKQGWYQPPTGWGHFVKPAFQLLWFEFFGDLGKNWGKEFDRRHPHPQKCGDQECPPWAIATWLQSQLSFAEWIWGCWSVKSQAVFMQVVLTFHRVLI